jgi:hypothetical protein
LLEREKGGRKRESDREWERDIMVKRRIISITIIIEMIEVKVVADGSNDF